MIPSFYIRRDIWFDNEILGQFCERHIELSYDVSGYRQDRCHIPMNSQHALALDLFFDGFFNLKYMSMPVSQAESAVMTLSAIDRLPPGYCLDNLGILSGL